MADFECRELEIGLESRHLSFDMRKNFSKVSFEPEKCTQVIRFRGAAAPRIFNSNYLFVYIEISVIRTLHVSVIVFILQYVCLDCSTCIFMLCLRLLLCVCLCAVCVVCTVESRLSELIGDWPVRKIKLYV